MKNYVSYFYDSKNKIKQNIICIKIKGRFLCKKHIVDT